jgi:hypothetical protein
MRLLMFNFVRKISLIAVIGLISFTAPANAQNSTTRFFIAFATETTPITVDNTAGGVAFTASKINSSSGMAQMTVFRVSCASTSPCSINYTIDASAPTTTHGVLLNEGDVVTIYNFSSISAFRAIRTGSNSAKIDPIYLK